MLIYTIPERTILTYGYEINTAGKSKNNNFEDAIMRFWRRVTKLDGVTGKLRNKYQRKSK